MVNGSEPPLCFQKSAELGIDATLLEFFFFVFGLVWLEKMKNSPLITTCIIETQ